MPPVDVLFPPIAVVFRRLLRLSGNAAAVAPSVECDLPRMLGAGLRLVGVPCPRTVNFLWVFGTGCFSTLLRISLTALIVIAILTLLFVNICSVVNRTNLRWAATIFSKVVIIVILLFIPFCLSVVVIVIVNCRIGVCRHHLWDILVHLLVFFILIFTITSKEVMEMMVVFPLFFLSFPGRGFSLCLSFPFAFF